MLRLHKLLDVYEKILPNILHLNMKYKYQICETLFWKEVGKVKGVGCSRVKDRYERGWCVEGNKQSGKWKTSGLTQIVVWILC